MIDNQTAIMLIKKLTEQGFIIREEEGASQKELVRLTENDLAYLNKHYSQGKYHKDRNGQILEAMIPGFMVSASKGETFVPEEDIVSYFGNTVEQNYPEASTSFLKFAKTYWSLRVLIDQLSRDDDGIISFIGGRLLGVLEGEIGPLFFPFPGPEKVPPAERENMQRELLKGFVSYSQDIDINIEDFINGNPILIRDRKAMRGNSGKGGGLMFLIISVFISTLIFIL